MRVSAIAALAACGMAVSGCATIIKGTTETVNVTSPPVRGARCVLTTADRYWDLITPSSVRLPRSGDDLSVVCTKRGFKDSAETIPSHFNFVTLGNLVIGGMVGVTVDAVSGANESYPADIALPMERLPRPDTPATLTPDPSAAPSS
jgi:hypothetical protein